MTLKYNDHVPYYEPAAEKAAQLCKDCKTEQEKFDSISKWVSRFIAYNYVKAWKMPKRRKTEGTIMPEVEECFTKKRGICTDITSLACSMMRSQGLEAYYVLGHVYHTYMGVKVSFSHAWVEVKINGELIRYDQTSLKQFSKRKRATLEYKKEVVY